MILLPQTLCSIREIISERIVLEKCQVRGQGTSHREYLTVVAAGVVLRFKGRG
jgi:hypothetical protein